MATAPPVTLPERIVNYARTSFLAATLAVGTVGASITFTIIVQDISDPGSDSRFTKKEVKTLLAIAWVLFVAAIALTNFFASWFVVYHEEIQAALKEQTYTRWHVFGVIMALGIQLELVGAFLCLELALLAYVEPVGWFAVSMTVVYGAMTVVFIVRKTPQLGAQVRDFRNKK
jgi:hypothetical protein